MMLSSRLQMRIEEARQMPQPPMKVRNQKNCRLRLLPVISTSSSVFPDLAYKTHSCRSLETSTLKLASTATEFVQDMGHAAKEA
jgi:hypothetical protein